MSPQINLPQGRVNRVIRVPVTADSVELLASVGVVVGIEWNDPEGGWAAIVRRLLETHPEVLRTAKAQGKTKAEVTRMFDIKRGSRLPKKKDETK